MFTHLCTKSIGADVTRLMRERYAAGLLFLTELVQAVMQQHANP